MKVPHFTPLRRQAVIKEERSVTARITGTYLYCIVQGLIFEYTGGLQQSCHVDVMKF